MKLSQSMMLDYAGWLRVKEGAVQSSGKNVMNDILIILLLVDKSII